jgi:N-acetylmuramoyl-L-alanine amidase
MHLKRLIILIMIALITYFSYVSYNGYINLNIAAPSVSYGWGSTGSTVTEIQRRLKNWGYYNGAVDGIYGYDTYTSVRYFQGKNGLTVDGITGPETLGALGINTGDYGTNAYSASSDMYLLSRAIYGESRGEPYVGQVAVGAVIINRTRDPRFPQTIAGVIYQPGAFTAVSDGQINLSPDEDAANAARDALNGWDPSGGAIYYFNPNTATSPWIWTRPIIKVIGNHFFCD